MPLHLCLVPVILFVLTFLYYDAVYVCFSSLGLCDCAKIRLVFDIAFSRSGSRQERMRIKQVQLQNILSLHNLSVVVQLHQLRLSRFLITEGFLGRGLQLDGGRHGTNGIADEGTMMFT